MTDAIARKRWAALDAFRGLAVMGMLLVNNPGEHGAVYRQLVHSEWSGCTIADLVFPFFLFAVGITTAIGAPTSGLVAEPSRSIARIARRAAIIFAIGFLINWFPFYQSGVSRSPVIRASLTASALGSWWFESLACCNGLRSRTSSLPFLRGGRRGGR